MPIVLIGKNSFLAKYVAEHKSCADWQYLSHTQALTDAGWAQTAKLVINFAFAPQMKIDGYSAEDDIDAALAQLIHPHTAHYITLSTRQVYGQSPYENLILKENLIPKPTTAYGQAKLQAEESLLSILGRERLTILRLGNIFGFEPGRPSFFGTCLKSLREENTITLNTTPYAIRDFLAAWHFADMLAQIASAPLPGLFNIGSGFPTPCISIAEWLIEGYGQGEIAQTGTSESGQFWMDMSKTKTTFNINLITPEDLRLDCLSCGYQLRKI